jgi:hypothetical protein
VKSIEDKSFHDGTMWEYKDPEGNIHGPFTLNQMRTWYQLNFFLPEVPMRLVEAKSTTASKVGFDIDEKEEEATSKFRPLSEIYPGGAALAFTYVPSLK